jgi:hypothetical protein
MTSVTKPTMVGMREMREERIEGGDAPEFLRVVCETTFLLPAGTQIGGQFIRTADGRELVAEVVLLWVRERASDPVVIALPDSLRGASHRSVWHLDSRQKSRLRARIKKQNGRAQPEVSRT